MRRTAVATLLALSACGGDSPTGPGPSPSPTAGSGHPVTLIVFYDENGDRRLDESERARVPGATVEVGGRRATTEKLTGRAVVRDVPAGPQTAAIDATSLPPFYVAGPAAPVVVPTAAEVLLSVTLPIGVNRPNTYMTFGDSITLGEGSSDGNGYNTPLQRALREHFGRASVVNRGGSGTRSTEGVERISRNLRLTNPAYTLVLYGTNDWVECKGALPCITIDSLRTILATIRDARSLPVLGTIIPANPDRNPEERNRWLKAMNELIRGLARDEGASLADLEAAFLREASLPPLFSDHVHPNDRGYQIMADEFFRAITEGGGP